MKNDRKTWKWTLLALLCYEGVLVSASLTSLSTIGNGTQFATPEMWANLLLMGICYGVPLGLYYLGIAFMKYLLAAVHVFWSIALPFMAGMALLTSLYYRAKGISDPWLMVFFGTSLLSLTINVVWFPMCFGRKTNRR